MLKRVFCILLVFVLMLQLSLNVGIAVYYHLNKAEITQKLCENKGKPQMHCNGHCYLSKQLKKAEEAEKKHASSVVKEKEEVISGQIEMFPATYYPDYIVVAVQHYTSALHTTHVSHSLLKPPSA